jgi:hypothetical protein
MQLLAGQFAALTVASIFYCYREYQDRQHTKEQRLRERVTFLLWMVAQATDH